LRTRRGRLAQQADDLCRGAQASPADGRCWQRHWINHQHASGICCKQQEQNLTRGSGRHERTAGPFPLHRVPRRSRALRAEITRGGRGGRKTYLRRDSTYQAWCVSRFGGRAVLAPSPFTFPHCALKTRCRHFLYTGRTCPYAALTRDNSSKSLETYTKNATGLAWVARITDASATLQFTCARAKLGAHCSTTLSAAPFPPARLGGIILLFPLKRWGVWA